MSGSMAGRVFNNRYQITERIGIGGMAEVYRAQDRVLGRMVAVKVMLPQYASDSEFTQRFRQEAAAAANLQNPYIVNVYDWGQDDGTYYIVMEYVRGSDLKTAIKQRGAINQRKVAEIGAQVCQALSVAHKQDIMHRDIKPQNIMVQPDGNVKVMDFGIARAKNSIKGQTSQVLGTAHYISPEQAQGFELTAASDIYSLGVVMYEATTGQLPFDGPDSVSVATKQVNEYPVPPSEINPNIDPGLEAIIMRALEKDPRARFATATDMKHALNDYLAGRQVAIDMMGETAYMPSYEPFNDPGTSVMPTLVEPVAPAYNGGKYASGSYSPVRNVSVAHDEDTNRNTKRAVAIVAAIIALALVAVLAFLGFRYWNNRPVAVPTVAGQSVASATTTLQQAGFTVSGQSDTYSDTVPAGQVVATDPEAGADARRGSSVRLMVSAGKEQTTVPNVTGNTAEQARQLIESAGLVAGAPVEVFSDTVAPGTVIEQDPAANTKVSVGSTVMFTVSKGADVVPVIDVMGRTEGDAVATLRNAGFLVEIYHNNSNSVPAGSVMDMVPAPSSSVARGSTIAITISDGAIMRYVSAEIYADPPTAAASVALDAYQVAEGSSVGYYITVPENYSISTVTDGSTDYGTSSTGTIYNVSRDTTLVVTLAYHPPAPEPIIDDNPDSGTSGDSDNDSSSSSSSSNS